MLKGCKAILSPNEQERADRFRFDRHRNRFIAARAQLRQVLGAYLQTNPAALTFSAGPNDKPLLGGSFKESGLHFNLTHSEDVALVAVTRIGEVGIDVERIRPIKDVTELVARFFSIRESELFQKLPAEVKPTAFFNLWTRKEAMLKATGEGITRSLKQVEVSFLPEDSTRVLLIAGDSEKASHWTLTHLNPRPGFVGALAIQANMIRVCCQGWD